MKVILRNTSLKFEKNAEEQFISSYDAFRAAAIANTGSITQVDASAEDKRCKVYDVSAFAGNKLHVELYFNLTPGSTENVNIISFSTNLVTHDDATSAHILAMNGGVITTEGMTKEWNIPDKPSTCCRITGEINIPNGMKAMAVLAGVYLNTGVSYPDNSKVFYYE